MKSGGLILWNAIAICEMSKTSWQMGKHVTNGDLENHLKARSFRLVQWLKIILFLQKDLSRLLQFYLEFTFGYALYAGGIWKGDILVADVEELEILEVSEIHARRLHAKEIITPKRVYNSYSQSQMEKLSCLEKIKFSEDPSEFRTTLHETKSTKTFFKESRTGLNR